MAHPSGVHDVDLTARRHRLQAGEPDHRAAALAPERLDRSEGLRARGRLALEVALELRRALADRLDDAVRDPGAPLPVVVHRGARLDAVALKARELVAEPLIHRLRARGGLLRDGALGVARGGLQDADGRAREVVEEPAGVVDRHGEVQVLPRLELGHRDAHHVPVGREDGSAARARGRGRAHLEELVALLLLPPAADDPGGDRVLQSQRTSDQHHGRADTHRIGVAQRQRREVEAGDLQHRDVAPLVLGQDLDLVVDVAGGELHPDVPGVPHDVVVRQDPAARVHDEAASLPRAGRRAHVEQHDRGSGVGGQLLERRLRALLGRWCPALPPLGALP